MGFTTTYLNALTIAFNHKVALFSGKEEAGAFTCTRHPVFNHRESVNVGYTLASALEVKDIIKDHRQGKHVATLPSKPPLRPKRLLGLGNAHQALDSGLVKLERTADLHANTLATQMPF
eukprot:3060799-Amphidinium_carterae.1